VLFNIGDYIVVDPITPFGIPNILVSEDEKHRKKKRRKKQSTEEITIKIYRK